MPNVVYLLRPDGTEEVAELLHPPEGQGWYYDEEGDLYLRPLLSAVQLAIVEDDE